MKTLTLSRPVLLGVAILLGLGVLLPTQNLPAQDASCIAVDRDGMPRSCTFLEEHGACLWNAFDSYYACGDASSGFWDDLACQVGVQVDLFACNMGLPLRLIKSVIG